MALENSGLFLEKVEKTKCCWVSVWLYEVYLNYNLNIKFALTCLQYWVATAWSGSEVLRGCSQAHILALSFIMTMGMVFSIPVPHFLICEHRIITWGDNDIGSLVVLLWGEDVDNGEAMLVWGLGVYGDPCTFSSILLWT